MDVYLYVYLYVKQKKFEESMGMLLPHCNVPASTIIKHVKIVFNMDFHPPEAVDEALRELIALKDSNSFVRTLVNVSPTDALFEQALRVIVGNRADGSFGSGWLKRVIGLTLLGCFIAHLHFFCSFGTSPSLIASANALATASTSAADRRPCRVVFVSVVARSVADRVVGFEAPADWSSPLFCSALT